MSTTVPRSDLRQSWSRLSGKQKAALAAGPLVPISMYPIFLASDALLGDRLDGYLGWYLGLVAYWLIWGLGFAVRMIGVDRVKALIRPRRASARIVALIAFPVLMAGAVRLLPGMGYEKHSLMLLLLILTTTVGNGFFEELLWRGVFLELFRRRPLVRVGWASVWFGLWHVVPVSMSPGGEVATMILGAMFFGFYLAFLAAKTDSLWWPMIAHFAGALVMIS